MTDELVYERLAISVGRTGSPLPAIHGVFVRSLDQLYPWLIAPISFWARTSRATCTARTFSEPG